jgi:hypothetical protein
MFNSKLSFDFFQVTSSCLSFGGTRLITYLKVLVASEVTGLLTLSHMARDSITVSHILVPVSCIV